MSNNNKSETEYEILYVDNNEKLQKLCENIKNAPLLILDTEFIREKTYRAKLCLIQIATDDIIACVDPIAITDLTPLMAIINDKFVQTGEKIGGYKVVRITPNTVYLRAGRHQKVIKVLTPAEK